MTNAHRHVRITNEQLFPKQWVIQLPQMKTAATYMFTYFLFKLQNRTKCNTEEPQQKYRLGTVNNRLLGGGGFKRVLLDPNPRPQILPRFKTFGPHEGFLTHQWINIGYKQITNMAYDESEMRTRQKRIVTLGEFEGVEQYHRNTGAKENHSWTPNDQATDKTFCKWLPQKPKGLWQCHFVCGIGGTEIANRILTWRWI